jgi:spore coat protein U-like protein
LEEVSLDVDSNHPHADERCGDGDVHRRHGHGCPRATASLAVSATVTGNCTISTSTVSFGSYDPVSANASANLDSTGTITFACTKGSAPTIGLGLGSNVSGTTRRLTDGAGNFLAYELYSDTGRSTVWTPTGGGVVTPGAALSKTARNQTVYGRITSNQDVPAGSYTDTIVATINF